MTLRRRVEQLEVSCGNECRSRAEVEQRRRVMVATLAQGLARILKLPIPPETYFLDNMPAEERDRLMRGRPLPPDFADLLARRLNVVESRLRTGWRPKEREDYERLLKELGQSTDSDERTDNQR